mmetsp:Transcript_57328/g.68512  ORF Transcript_57328/g.68512 Transcript_57328/m.68512 type:complete len:112 (+) Transcript_57328:796-1131(+)
MACFPWKNLIDDSQSDEIEFLTPLAASLYYYGGTAASFTAPSALFVTDTISSGDAVRYVWRGKKILTSTIPSSCVTPEDGNDKNGQGSVISCGVGNVMSSGGVVTSGNDVD